ncbi:hypothetical protein P4O66_011325, partial [Electrophorus voltai]
MKCFKKIVRDFITSSLPASMDPLQFAYRHNRSTDDAIAHLLYTTLTHLDKGRDRPQSVRVGNCASSTLTLSTEAPQGCVLSPLLYSLYTYDYTATSSSTIIVKFADNTVVMGLISDNDERAYLEEMVFTSHRTCPGNITVWFGNSTKQDRQALQKVVRSAKRITHTELPDLQTIYYRRCQTKARRIVKDPTHPNNRLFSLL